MLFEKNKRQFCIVILAMLTICLSSIAFGQETWVSAAVDTDATAVLRQLKTAKKSLSGEFFSVVFQEIVGNLAGKDLSSETTAELVRLIKKEKRITNDTVGEAISLIIGRLVEDEYSSPFIKRELFRGMSKGRIMKLADAAATEEGDLLMLMFWTKQKVRNDYTDKKLYSVTKRGGIKPKRSVAKIWNRKTITTDLVRVLEVYPPETAKRLAEIACEPWFTGNKLPYGASYTTWASESYWTVTYYANLAEFTRRSTVLKLLVTDGTVWLPDIVYAEFVWSGAPPVPIDISIEPFWSTADVPELERLLGNEHYSAPAGNQLGKLDGGP